MVPPGLRSRTRFPCSSSTTSRTTWTRSASTSARASRCCSAGSGEEALALVKQHDVAVIVTDQRMPRMTGLELLKAARELRPDAVGHHRDGLHRRRRAHRGHQPRPHLSLRHQALGLEGAARHPHPRHRALPAGAREPAPARAAAAVRRHAVERRARRVQLRRHRGRLAARCATCWRASSRWRRRRRPCCCAARPAPARRWWRAPSTSTARARRARSCASTARRWRPACSSPSCSATRRAPSPARSRGASAASSWPTAARCSSTRSATCRSTCRSSCCACCRSASSSAWAAPRRSRSTCASSRRPTAISSSRSPPASFARISTTGSTSSRSCCRRCASGPATSRGLCEHFIQKYAQSAGKSVRGVDAGALAALAAYAWPGNVRELENVIERALILARGAELTAADLEFSRRPAPRGRAGAR